MNHRTLRKVNRAIRYFTLAAGLAIFTLFLVGTILTW